MAGIKNNRRTQYTIHVIEESLIALLQHHPLEKITVTAICEAADVNRGTFYRYFQDPFDCFNQIQDAFFQQMLDNLPLFDRQKPTQFLTAILTTFQKNAPLMRALLMRQNSSLLEKFFQHRQALPDAASHQEQYELTFYSNGISSICRHWLDLGMPESPAELARLIMTIMHQGPTDIPDPPELTTH
ncbi:TetR/AcrR family transcriptional regulator [Levilactobacillus namurensis]|uniref:TetR/AcrR family transcriptional regulator n=1 Tax=Levilactobacillus namurensis TaxID=380393 RepID=UPI002230E5B6|nr:TetR/AcrR family transcriptional regulator [Levilactobacillus namurensis]MCW3778126.1 TetR/AcrR family transcriptional regulator [Levilactobacillus namurensis]MDT7018117.1 TetR/AcrR family transcriptional regulator [Levilactobacillus namurensis]WNN64894.1 TetR/AcrR family transcriptional regulator [Levilactobacillus namurensis]